MSTLLRAAATCIAAPLIALIALAPEGAPARPPGAEGPPAPLPALPALPTLPASPSQAAPGLPPPSPSSTASPPAQASPSPPPPKAPATAPAPDGLYPPLGSDTAGAPEPAPPPSEPVPDLPLAGGPGTLPPTVAQALRLAKVPVSSVGYVVMPLSGPRRGPGTADARLSLSVNAGVPMNPASTMKLVTTYAALNLLGPAYTWQTEALAGGPVLGDTLQGPLVLRGGGDPQFVVEHLWLLVQRIRQQGIRQLAGDLLLDTAAFEPGSYETGTLDGDELRPYNVAPHPLLLNYKSVTISFVPDTEARLARLVALPQLAGMRVPAGVPLVDGPCGDWKGRLQPDFSDPMGPQFRGAFPLACGERLWNISVLNHASFVGATFRTLWEASGGTWAGQAREGQAPAGARRLAVHASAPLAMVIREINKFSNNVMTRQLFLTMGAEATRQPATPERAARAVRDWTLAHGLPMPELVQENGSGLSRIERIAPASMAKLLAHAWASPVMPELMASLPVPGIDGTMRNRHVAVGRAHVKTGLLADVRAIAGYVLAASGRRYVVVGFINHPNAGAAVQANDALLQWVYQRG